MTDLERTDVTPYPKTVQLARKERRYRRKVASPKQWQAILAAKQGPCRLCGAPPPSQMHHLIPRDRGGADVAENCIPLCSECHAAVEHRNPDACGDLVASTWSNQPEPGPNGAQDEYSWACEHYGNDWPERVYGVRYVAPSGGLSG